MISRVPKFWCDECNFMRHPGECGHGQTVSAGVVPPRDAPSYPLPGDQAEVCNCGHERYVHARQNKTGAVTCGVLINGTIGLCPCAGWHHEQNFFHEYLKAALNARYGKLGRPFGAERLLEGDETKKRDAMLSYASMLQNAPHHEWEDFTDPANKVHPLSWCRRCGTVRRLNSISIAYYHRVGESVAGESSPCVPLMPAVVENESISWDVIVPPGATFRQARRTRVSMRPTRFIIDAADFFITKFMFGKNTVMEGFPANAYAEPMLPAYNALGFPVLHPMVDTVIEARNDSKLTLEFRAVLFGRRLP
jgi:hypothetical protein